MNKDQITIAPYERTELPPGSVLAGRFRIEDCLGNGFLGTVYRAIDEQQQMPIALKLLRKHLVTHPEAFERTRRKLLRTQQIVSPHVVRIHDFTQDEGRWLVSTDAIDGEGLDQRLFREGPLAIDVALKITRQIALGLGAGHAHGIAHLDLRPANVLIGQDGSAWISDFGLVRALTEGGMTESDAVFDMSDYMPPEQLRYSTSDARSDLYALGLILYKMLTGAFPFDGDTPTVTMTKRVFNITRPLKQMRPEAPTWVARLVDRLLQTQPVQRLTAAEVVSAIDRRRVPPLPWSTKRPSAHAVAIGLAAFVVLAVGIGIAWWQTAVAPLQRVLVLPIERRGGDAALDDRITGLSAHLRDALAASIAVVDGERTEQALRQLDSRDRTSRNLAALYTTASADRVLQPRLVMADRRWRLQVDLQTDDADKQHIDGPRAADPIAALRAGLPALTAALGLEAADLDLALPARAAALDAYGAAMRMQWRNGPGEATVVALRRVTRADPGYVTAWLALAEAARIAGEDKTASAAIEHGQRLAMTVPSPVPARFKAARALLDGDAAIAVAQWRTLSKAMPDDGYAALNLARAQAANGELDAATAGLRRLTARDQNDPRAWLELGKAAIRQGDADHAVNDYLLQALQRYRSGRDHYGEAETANQFAIAYGRLGLTGAAEQQYQKALQLWREIGDRRGIAGSLHSLAIVAGQRGKFEQAVRYLDEARALYTAIGDRQGMAAVESQAGLLAERRGDFRTALAAYRRALTTRRQIGDAPGESRSLYDIGFAAYQFGDYADAQVFWEQAALAYNRLGDAIGGVRIELSLGLLAIARGHWDDARQGLMRSLPTAQKRKMLPEVAMTHRYLAELEFWQGHWHAAFAQMDRAEALFSQIEYPRALIDTRLLHVQALLASHDTVAAQQVLDALAPTLTETLQEYRAIAAILHAELAQRQGDVRRTTQALAEARRLADATGIRQLQLQAELLSAKSQPGDLAKLDADTAALGHAGLRLAFLELAMSQALDANDDATVAAHLYRQAQSLLRGRDYLRAVQLHALGVEALAAIGDLAGASGARQAVDAARAALQAQIEKMTSRAATLDDTNSSSLISTGDL